ncbi:hypothetical protein Bca52824_051473 [Brassica carinata]|uniref:Uncharacterized protein n=1 Tax=Brassica carinata TaxID=52824 RepID=A0A8X7R094_BRACI|nr:hypothetical protein Bca52824_051473 [Brassica carinata]
MVSKISGGGVPLVSTGDSTFVYRRLLRELLVCVNLELRTIALADDVLMNLTSVGSTVVLFGGLFVASMRSLTAVCSSLTAVCSLAVVCSPLSIIRLSHVWSSLFSQYFLLYGVNWMNKRRWYCKDLPPSDCSPLRLVQYVWSYGLH